MYRRARARRGKKEGGGREGEGKRGRREGRGKDRGREGGGGMERVEREGELAILSPSLHPFSPFLPPSPSLPLHPSQNHAAKSS